MSYTFSVRAQTIDYGPAVKDNVTTGPQEGSPTSPQNLVIMKMEYDSAVKLKWTNGPSGQGPILGYHFQYRPNGKSLFIFTHAYRSLCPPFNLFMCVLTYSAFFRP